MPLHLIGQPIIHMHVAMKRGGTLTAAISPTSIARCCSKEDCGRAAEGAVRVDILGVERWYNDWGICRLK